MDFKSIKNRWTLLGTTSLLTLAYLTGCTVPVNDSAPKSQERVVGERLQDIAPPDRDTGATTHIALFDHTTRMIHQFNLNQMRYDRGLHVDSADLEHVVLFHEDGNYVVDFADKNFAIYDSDGVHRASPFQMPGKIQSAAFRPRLGDLAVYDSTNALGLVKLNSEGHVTGYFLGGPLLASSDGTENNLTLVAADLTESGQLIAALSDNSISIIDFDQAVNTQSWPKQPTQDHFATTLSNITWIGPVRGQPNLVLLRDDRGISLMNLTSQSIISQYLFSSSENLHLLSKAVDSHFITGDLSGGTIRLGFVPDGGSVIQTRLLNQDPSLVTSSRLNLKTNSWMLSRGQTTDFDNSTTEVISYRLTDLLALGRFTFPLKAQVKLLEGRAFALYPSALGHAVTYDMQSGTSRTFDNFNVGN